jgi:hypothetical protein
MTLTAALASCAGAVDARVADAELRSARSWNAV